MRTKNEVLAYLKENGHSNNAITKIMGFLIGVGIKEPNERIVFKRGENSWEEFFEWYNNEPKKKECPLYNILSILNDRRNETDDIREIARIDDCIGFLVSEFVLDVSRVGEETHISGFEKGCERRNKNR